METNHSLRQTLEHFLQQKQKKLEELRSLEFTIRQLKRELGEEEKGEGEEVKFLSPMIENISEQRIAIGGKEPDIRPDEFFGMTQSDAAKAYLERVGYAVSFEQLVGALRKGGCKVGGINPARTLYISLIRNVREFVPPQTGYIGLRKFYPNLKSEAVINGKAKKLKKKRGRPPKAVKKENMAKNEEET